MPTATDGQCFPLLLLLLLLRSANAEY